MSTRRFPIAALGSLFAFLLGSCQAVPYEPDLSIRVSSVVHEDGFTTAELIDFDPVKAKQRDPLWCWAACAEMLHAYNGVAESQEAIALRIDGTDEEGEPKREAARLYEIACALNSEMSPGPFEAIWEGIEESIEETLSEDPATLEGDVDVSADGHTAVVSLADQFAPASAPAIEDLIHGHPAVVGLRDPGVNLGHAYLMVGATYQERAGQWQGLQGLEEGIRKVGEVVPLDGVLGERTGDVIEASARPEFQAASDRLASRRYVTKVLVLIDPANEERVTMDMDEFAERVDFVLSKRDAKKMIERWQEIAKVEVQ